MKLEKALQECDTIVFLCSGNLIRSAFADIYSKHINIPKTLKSAGTDYYNAKISNKVIKVLESMGVDNNLIENFKPTNQSELVLDPNQMVVVFGMKNQHIAKCNIAKEQVLGSYLLSEISGTKIEIADPYFEGGFDDVIQLIKKYVDKISDFMIKLNHQ